ncbi:MAG: FkbM family methyltransferase [Balneolales bacterium]
MHKKVWEITKKEHILNLLVQLVAIVYKKTVRTVLPTTGYVTYNGIKIKPIKFGDRYLSSSWRSYKQQIRINYESALVNGLKSCVKQGDKVVIVGGGAGVTTIYASKLTGTAGKVICYEVKKNACKNIRHSLRINSVPDNITIVNRCVGQPVKVREDLRVKDFVNPGDLPDCDVLELDCEGAERGILESMAIRPRVILVETHGLYGSSTEQILKILENADYRIETVEVAEPDLQGYCLEHDIHVITAMRAQ